MIKYDLYYTCPFCSNTYKGMIPKGGDGSEVIFPRHKKRIKDLTYTYRSEVCPGSRRPVDEKMREEGPLL